jgi:hypothetical protein
MMTAAAHSKNAFFMFHSFPISLSSRRSKNHFAGTILESVISRDHLLCRKRKL